MKLELKKRQRNTGIDFLGSYDLKRLALASVLSFTFSTDLYANDYAQLSYFLQAFSDDSYVFSNPLLIVATVLIILAVIILGMFSLASTNGSNSMTRWLGLSPHASDLFLGIDFTSQNGEPNRGYLRFISTKEAIMVSSVDVVKGEILFLELASLPSFPSQVTKLETRVIRIKMLEGNPKSYLIKVKFPSLAPESMISLKQYLYKLTS